MVVVDGCSGQRLRLALAQMEMELRAEQSLSIFEDDLCSQTTTFLVGVERAEE